MVTRSAAVRQPDPVPVPVASGHRGHRELETEAARGARGRRPRMRKPASPNPDLLAITPLAVTVEQAAQMLGIGRALMYKLVMRREVDSFTVGRARRIAVCALEEYVSRRRGA